MSMTFDLSRRDAMRLLGLAAATAPLGSVWADMADEEWMKLLPALAPAKPKKPRRLLIFGRNVDYGNGHSSIPVANQAFTLMGQKTGAFETVISNDPQMFQPATLKTFDAVFMNNTVGNLFTDPELRKSLLEFVTGGGGLMGVHGTSVAFTRWAEHGKEDWPEFAVLLGMRGAYHRANTEQVVMKLEEPGSPILACFGGKAFALQDEFFRPKGTYSRMRDRVLFSLDVDKSQLQDEKHDGAFREDRDYAMAWVRQYGRGRIFYTAFGHHPAIFRNPKLLEMYLAAAQFVLGDLEVPSIPSAKVTPAIRAQEKLGWKLGVEAYTFHKNTFFETIDKAHAMGLAYVGGLSFQKVSAENPKNLTPDLSDDELQAVRYKLDSVGMRIITYYYQSIPGDEAGCRKVFEFGRKLGITCFMSEPALDALPMIDRMAQEYGIKVGLHNHGPKASPNTWSPEKVLATCSACSPMIGAAADLGYWMREGIDLEKGLTLLKDRVITLQVHDLDGEGKDLPWGTGRCNLESFFRKVHALGIRPEMFGLEYSANFGNNDEAVKKSADFFNHVSLKMAEEMK